MVVNSIGKPPAARTPSLACLASRSSGRLHGVTSFQDDATAICGFAKSSSVIPTARSIARARCPLHAVGDLGAARLGVPARLAHGPGGYSPPRSARGWWRERVRRTARLRGRRARLGPRAAPAGAAALRTSAPPWCSAGTTPPGTTAGMPACCHGRGSPRHDRRPGAARQRQRRRPGAGRPGRTPTWYGSGRRAARCSRSWCWRSASCRWPARRRGWPCCGCCRSPRGVGAARRRGRRPRRADRARAARQPPAALGRGGGAAGRPARPS